MKKQVAVILAVALSLTTIMTGCGGNKSKDKAESSGKIKVRFASWDVAEDVDRQQKMVDEFNKAHKDIEVSLEAYGNDFDTKISAGMGSGDAPDVMYMWDYPSYASGLEPLDDYIAKEGADYKSDFYDTLWNYNSLDKKTYGIPVGFTTHGLYYNKDLFAKAGVAEPTDSWTWDDLEKAARTISEKTGAKGFSFQMKPDPYDFEMYLWSNGTAYCDKDGKLKGNLDSKKSQQVFQMFQDMEKAGYATATEDNGTDEFRAGSTAMYVYGSWAIDTLNKDGLKYGVVTIPSFKDGSQKSVSILSSSGVAMSKKSKHKEAAWEFIKFWTSKKANKERIGLELPVLHSVVDSEKIAKKPEYAPFYTMLDQSANYTPASFIMKDWPDLKDNLSQTFEEMFNPSTLQKVPEALKEAVNQ